MAFVSSSDLVAGTRIHGVVLGLQAGVRGVCIAHDSRTRELCETLGVPFLPASEVPAGVTLERLRDAARVDGPSFDRNRAALRRTYVDFLTSNGLQVAADLSPPDSYGAARRTVAAS